MTNSDQAEVDSWRLVSRSAEICAREAATISNRMRGATEGANGLVVPVGTNAHINKLRASIALLIDLTAEAL
jgi:hypothetical protein